MHSLLLNLRENPFLMRTTYVPLSPGCPNFVIEKDPPFSKVIEGTHVEMVTA